MKSEVFDPKNWDFQTPISSEQVTLVENKLNVKFPKSYKNIIKDYNNGKPDSCCFEISNYEYGPGSIGVLLNLKEEKFSLVDTYLDPPEFFPKDLVAFAEDGCGNFTCFDYRENPNTDNPPIVFWIHDEDPDVWKVANSFDEFLDMLYKDED